VFWPTTIEHGRKELLAHRSLGTAGALASRKPRSIDSTQIHLGKQAKSKAIPSIRPSLRDSLTKSLWSGQMKRGFLYSSGLVVGETACAVSRSA
jgi:hypothetical protein